MDSCVTEIRAGIIVFLLLTGIARAASDAERELQRILQERDTAIAAATEPINRRAQSALDQLLRKATQSGDLDIALKIREALSRFDAKSFDETVPADSVTSRVLNSSWTWWGAETITFEGPGKARWSKGGEVWKWSATLEPNTIAGVTGTGYAFTIRFDPDFRKGTIEGAGGTRPTLRMRR